MPYSRFRAQSLYLLSGRKENLTRLGYIVPHDGPYVGNRLWGISSVPSGPALFCDGISSTGL
jgi:hypothetical protein